MTAEHAPAMVSPPQTAPHASSNPAAEPQRTAPQSVIVSALSSLQNAIFPAVAAAFGTGISGFGLYIGLGVGAAIALLGAVGAYLRWTRLTYTIGDQDIRVESGVLSRAARSVPYERIQDVSLEQKLVPRILGLVSVKFETGAGGADDLALTYLKESEGERLRELVRERRDEADGKASAPLGSNTTTATGTATGTAAPDDLTDGEALFTMGPRRLFVFGLFEFSLAVFAVLGGLLQYVDSILDIEVWDVDFWRALVDEQASWLLALAPNAQVLSAIAGLFGVFVIGSVTGLARTFNREWEFRLERSARGFRRRRGLLTKTDVVMPVHRVQALTIGTRFIRYRFGWHSLRFVSLAQDLGSSSHVVAPFAKLAELAPIVAAAGFRLPSDNTGWHRAKGAYRNVSVAITCASFVAIAIVVGIASPIYSPEWTLVALGIVAAIAGLSVLADYVSWRFKRHALDDDQIVAVAGVLAPATQIATRVKLHSVEIAQGPLAKMFGYATLHLGLAGGEFSIPGIPLDRAREVRRQVLDTIAATDFSQLESQQVGSTNA